eukprot:gene18442-24917_t
MGKGSIELSSIHAPFPLSEGHQMVGDDRRQQKGRCLLGMALVIIFLLSTMIFLSPLINSPYMLRSNSGQFQAMTMASKEQPVPVDTTASKEQPVPVDTASVTGRHACEAYLESSVNQPFSVVMTADPGIFSGTPEAHYILNNLQDSKKEPQGDSVCADVQYGYLMGQEVLIVTSGIGAAAAGLCTLEVTTACGPWITEIIYFGTSGWSPQLGGVLNPEDCSRANDNGKIVRTVDFPLSANWKSTWNQQSKGSPNQCVRPGEVANPSDTPLFGKCMFFEDNLDAYLDLAMELTDAARSARDKLAANLDLAMELTDAARSDRGKDNQPLRSPHVSEHGRIYWDEMRNATGEEYPEYEQSNPPSVFDYTQCMEVDGQFFFSGVPWELKARDYAAMTLNAAMAHQKGALSSRWGGRAAGPEFTEKNFTARDMIAVSAMEGVGIAEALLRYHGLTSTRHQIPYTNLRTASNWLHPPVKKTVLRAPPLAVSCGPTAGCMSQKETGHLPNGQSCSFDIDYNGEVLYKDPYKFNI